MSAGAEASRETREAEQFLTASFELRPSRRKAAMLERRRGSYEEIFFDVVSRHEEAIGAVDGADRKAQKAAIAAIERDALRTAIARGLNEPLAQGLAREIKGQASSYLELKKAGQEAEWPRKRERDERSGCASALARLAGAVTMDEENEARDELLRAARSGLPRPMTLARSRDVRILRKERNGALVAALNIARAKDEDARDVVIEAGVDASTGEKMARKITKTAIVVPIACSKWHENRFLSGRAELRSALIVRRGDRWFLNAQFAYKVAQRETRTYLGVDRGIVNLVSGAVVDGVGGVVDVLPLAGNEVAAAMREAEQRAKAHQRRTARAIPQHGRRSHHLLHELSNKIVKEAKIRGARVVVESLTGLKQTITARREKGSRKGGWRKHMKQAQLGKLEAMLSYKLRLAGLPGIKEVPAGETSQTCSACGRRDRESRRERDAFRCVACGFGCDADLNGAVQIARRGAMKVSKGDRLVDLHGDMVAALASRDDGGLGPLAARTASGFVASRVSANAPNERDRGDSTCPDAFAGQNAHSRRSKCSQEHSGRADRRKNSTLVRSGFDDASKRCSKAAAGGGDFEGEGNILILLTDRKPAAGGGDFEGKGNKVVLQAKKRESLWK